MQLLAVNVMHFYILIVLSFMSYICTGCNVAYPSLKGLERHENQCGLKIEQQIVPDNAYEIYTRKKERKRQQALERKQRNNTSSLPLSELPYVRWFTYMILLKMKMLTCCIAFGFFLQ